ncbi:protease, putative [Theileria annulata]|uniref:Protease, putative n=1 Tax=Theileria annulata TaxID=5874 RepID=Q4UB20_THEAN|nr:protease, putative [Theileria annulata]CAI75981.1 protease, putative [Theileria annulata]|eukprot:XP_955457.1 protease, putative [Theileria annulata]
MNKYGRWLKFVFISVFYWIHLQQCVTIQINILNHNTIPINKTIIPFTNNSIPFTSINSISSKFGSIPSSSINSVSSKFGSVPSSSINSIPFTNINHVPYKFGRLGFINTNVLKFTKFNTNYNLTECKLVKDKSITHLDKQQTPLPNELKKQSLTTNLSLYVSKFLKNVKESNPYKYLTVKLSKFCVMIFGSALHTLVLSKCRFVLPYQLIPFNSGLGTEVTLDTLISIPILYYILKDYTFTQSTLETNNLKPKLEDNNLKSKLEDNKLTNKSKMVNINQTSLDEKYFQLPVRSKFKISMVVTSLLGSFIVSSYFSQFIDSLLLLVSAFDFPISVGMLKSFSVMSSHLFWVFIGSLILKSCMFPIFSKSNPWYKLDLSKLWVHQVLMGYYSSYTIYKLADIGYYLFLKFFDIQNQVSLTDEQISNICETNETIPILITSIGPCLTAPWWEELLYRVFTFKLFNSFLPTLYSSIASSIIFSINHLSPHSFLQLFSLGLLWSFIQLNNDNILITILIHSLWNSRIFFGSLTGI